MTDEAALRKDMERAARAKALAEDETLRSAFDAFERDLIAIWKNTRPDDVQGRERIWMTGRVLGAVRGNLETIIANGELAKAELDAILGR